MPPATAPTLAIPPTPILGPVGAIATLASPSASPLSAGPTTDSTPTAATTPLAVRLRGARARVVAVVTAPVAVPTVTWLHLS